MSDEIDNRLVALFARAHETLPGAEFTQAFLARVERARRLRNMRRIAAGLGLALLAAWIMPSVLAATASAVQAAERLVVDAVGEQPSSFGALVTSPVGWATSMLIAFLVLLKTGALRRR